MSNNGGELFVQLGTVGDSKDLERFVAKIKEGAIAIEKFMEKLDESNDKSKKKTDKNTKSINENSFSLGGLIKKVGKYKVALTVAFAMMNRFTNELVRSNQEYLNLIRTSDLALSTFQKWDSVGRMFGVQGLGGQLDSLNQRLFELRLTGQGARGFQLAGINPAGLDAEGVLERLRDRIAGMDDTTASYLIQQMGLDPKTITLLRMSRYEFEELWKSVKKYQLTEKQRKEIERLNIQLQVAYMKLGYLKDRAILKLLPIFTRFIDNIAYICEGVAKLCKFVGDLKIGSVALSDVIKTVLIPTLITLGFCFHPIYTALLMLYLLFDDIRAFFEGGKSGIGYLLYFLKELQDKINFETPKWVKDMLALFQSSNSMLDTLTTIKNIKDGKDNKVSVAQLGKRVSENFIFKTLIDPMHNPHVPFEAKTPNLMSWMKRGIDIRQKMQNGFQKGSVYSIDRSTKVEKKNSINIKADIFTNAPVEAIFNELNYAQRLPAITRD